MVVDPKGLQYILHTSGYRFPKRADIRGDTRFMLGDGIVWAHGQYRNIFALHVALRMHLIIYRRNASTPPQSDEPCLQLTPTAKLRDTVPPHCEKGNACNIWLHIGIMYLMIPLPLIIARDQNKGRGIAK